MKNVITISLRTSHLHLRKISLRTETLYACKRILLAPFHSPKTALGGPVVHGKTKNFVVIRQSRCDTLSYNNNTTRTCQGGSPSKKNGRSLSPQRRFALASSSSRRECSTRYFVRTPWRSTTLSTEISFCRAIFTRSCFCGTFRRSPFLLFPFTRRSPLIRLIRICAPPKTLSNYGRLKIRIIFLRLLPHL